MPPQPEGRRPGKGMVIVVKRLAPAASPSQELLRLLSPGTVNLRVPIMWHTELMADMVCSTTSSRTMPPQRKPRVRRQDWRSIIRRAARAGSGQGRPTNNSGDCNGRSTCRPPGPEHSASRSDSRGGPSRSGGRAVSRAACRPSRAPCRLGEWRSPFRSECLMMAAMHRAHEIIGPRRRHRAQHEQRQGNRPGRFEGAVRKVAMEPDANAEPGGEPENGKQRPIQLRSERANARDRGRSDERQDVEQRKMLQLQAMKCRAGKDRRHRADRRQSAALSPRCSSCPSGYCGERQVTFPSPILLKCWAARHTTWRHRRKNPALVRSRSHVARAIRPSQPHGLVRRLRRGHAGVSSECGQAECQVQPHRLRFRRCPCNWPWRSKSGWALRYRLT